MRTLFILLAMTASVEAEIMFSDSQCRVLRQMRVDTRGGCPSHIRATVQVQSPHADEANYNKTVSSVAMGGLGARDNSGVAGNSDRGYSGGSFGVGDSGSDSAQGGHENPGGGGGIRGEHPIRPIKPIKPPTFKPEIDRKPIFKPPDLTKEQKRRLISKIRKEREEGDWNPGNIGKPGRPGKAHEGRNSK